MRQALYHCITTTTTVGYGDVVMETQGSRYAATAQLRVCADARTRPGHVATHEPRRRSSALTLCPRRVVAPRARPPAAGSVVATIHIAISVTWLAAFVGHISQLRDVRRAQLQRAELLRRKLDAKLIAGVVILRVSSCNSLLGGPMIGRLYYE